MRKSCPDGCVFVIFGGTGDLARRKILPALYELARTGAVPGTVRVVGVARDASLNDERYREWVREGLSDAEGSPDEVADWGTTAVTYHTIGKGTAADFASLRERIEALEAEAELPGHRIFYIALPPGALAPTVSGLADAGLNRSKGWTRLVVEKPFGHDLSSARKLNRLIHQSFDEAQVFRIDHYLGKETVQNLLVLRFANAFFESLWSRNHVGCVEITVAEDLGVGSRAGYYEGAGALRDMVQNHLAQLLSLIAMEVPTAFEADAIRTEKTKVLRSIASIRPERVVLGQYGAGVIDGQKVTAYRDEADVASDSSTETFAALRLDVDTWRWQGVPFILRTGKRLPRRVTEIAVVFRRPPVCMFEAVGGCELDPNILVLRMQPDEGFQLHFGVKAPGDPFRVASLPLHFNYDEAFPALPEAYLTLIQDVMEGDQTLFVHADEVEAAWALFEPLMDGALAVHPYPAGSWGPDEVSQLLPEGIKLRNPA